MVEEQFGDMRHMGFQNLIEGRLSQMNRWEYTVRLLDAQVSKESKVLTKEYPDWQIPKYHPVSLEPALNEFGQQGWELMCIEPVHVGLNADIRLYGDSRHWSHTYLCVFKRQLP